MIPTESDIEYLAPFAPDALPTIAGGWEERDLRAGSRTYRIFRPAQPDALLDTAETLAAHQVNGYMPYWGYLWPSTFDMCSALELTEFPPGLPALEIGAGIGVVGLTGLKQGLEVTFSDYDRTSIQLALTNAIKNGCTNGRGMFLDWNQPPRCEFPFIMGCEVIYEPGNHAPILDLLDQSLTFDGECWLADPRRHSADKFIALAQGRGYHIDCWTWPHEPYDTSAKVDIEIVTDIWILRKAAPPAFVRRMPPATTYRTLTGPAQKSASEK